MHAESVDDIFTYIGQAPNPSSKEKKKTEEYIKESKREYQRQIECGRHGLRFDGTRIKY